MRNAIGSEDWYKSSSPAHKKHNTIVNKPINMAAKFVVFFGMLAVASAVAAPLVPIAKLAYAEAEAPAQYEFQYSVHDEQSGDIKQQQEARSGDDVQGSYSLVQPDGLHRVVDYTSDEEHGFNAVVRYEGTPHAAPAPAKLTYAAPLTKLAYGSPVANLAYAGPAARLTYAAPVTRLTYAAPAAKLAYQAPIAYQTSLGQVSFSSPAYSYSH
ncbi:unnamed protein product, partial [Brenthis ino]